MSKSWLMGTISLFLLAFCSTTESLPIPRSQEPDKNSSSMIVRVVVTSSSSSSTSSEDYSQFHDFSLPVFSSTFTTPTTTTTTTPTTTINPTKLPSEAREYPSIANTFAAKTTFIEPSTSKSISSPHKSEEVEDIFSAFYRAFSHSNSNNRPSLSHSRGFPPLISSRSLPPTPRRVDGGGFNKEPRSAEESQKVVSVVSSSKSSVSIQKTPRPKVSVPSFYTPRRRSWNGTSRKHETSSSTARSTSTTSTAPSWQETEKVWGEPAKVWSLPAQVWSEPEKVWSQPEIQWSPSSSAPPNKPKSWRQAKESDEQRQKPVVEVSPPDYSNDEPINSQEPGEYEEGVTQGPFVVLGEDENEQDSIDGEIDGHLVLPATLSSSSIPKISSSSNYNENISSSRNNSQQQPTQQGKSNLKFGYVLEGSNVRRYRVEERTPDGFIVGEYGVLNNQNAFLRGVRYTADGTINPRLIHEALMKFLSLRR